MLNSLGRVLHTSRVDGVPLAKPKQLANTTLSITYTGYGIPGDFGQLSSQTPTAWTDTLTAAQLASLGTGPVNLTAVQTSQKNVRLGFTTLDQITAVATPKPGSLALLGFDVLGLAGLKLSKR